MIKISNRFLIVYHYQSIAENSILRRYECDFIHSFPTILWRIFTEYEKIMLKTKKIQLNGTQVDLLSTGTVGLLDYCLWIIIVNFSSMKISYQDILYSFTEKIFWDEKQRNQPSYCIRKSDSVVNSMKRKWETDIL